MSDFIKKLKELIQQEEKENSKKDEKVIILEKKTKFEVMSNDLEGEYTLKEALEAAWKIEYRLPTREELNIMYENRDKIGNLKKETYWSSTEYDTINAWLQYFGNGYKYFFNKNYLYRVRCVRDI